MNWACLRCGATARTNRRRCPKCGSMHWKSAPKKDIGDFSGPMKRIAPRGLLLARPGRQAPTPDPGGIECGTCHAVIYKAEGVFDAGAFEAAKKRHYSVSPACESRG